VADQKSKILIIDDDIELREMYAEIFQNENFEVLQASGGAEGFDLATRELPDVVFTGIMMPGMDGFSMIEALRKNPTTASIPFVISSHTGREDDNERAANMGVKDFIVRGVTRPVEVIERIKAVLDAVDAEYRLEFDVSALDAQPLAKELNIGEDFKCSNCGEKLSLGLKFEKQRDGVLEARFFCPSCGLKVK